MMKKVRVKQLAVLTAFLICILAGFALEYYADQRLQKEIRQLTARKIGGLYSLQVGKAELDIWTGGLTASDISIHTDTAAWARVRQSRPDSFPPFLDFTLRSVDIRRFSWLSYFFNRNIKIQALLLDAPRGAFMFRANGSKTGVSAQERVAALHKALSPVAKNLYIKEINFHDGEVTFNLLENRDTMQRYVSGLDILLTDLNISRSTTPANICNNIEVMTARGETRSSAGTHTLRFAGFSLSKAAGALRFDEFSFLPHIDEKEFFSRQHVRVNYLSFSSPVLSLQGFDLVKFFESGYFVADSLQLEQPVLKAVVNHYLPLPDRKILPHELVQKANFPFDIKHIVIKDSDISVKALIPAENYLLEFNHTYFNAENLSNDSSLMDSGHPFRIWAEGDFMNHSPIKLQLNLFLLSPGFNGNYTATVRNLPLGLLNPVLKNKNISIESGFMSLADINVDIRNGVAKGTVKMQYKDLEVNILKKRSRTPRKVLSDFADWFIKDNNLPDNDPSTPFVVGEINHERDRQEGFLLFLWLSIQDGMLPSIAPITRKFYEPKPK